MNELTKKVSLIGTGLIVGAASFSVIGASAHNDNGDQSHRQKSEVVSQVLGISVEDLRASRDDGQTLEELVTSNGFENLEAFEAAMETAIRENLAEKGLSEEEIDAKVEDMRQHRDIRQDVQDARETVFGLSRDDVKAKLDSGMTMEEILAEAGFDSREDMKAAMSDELRTTWEAEGLSEDEIQERLDQMEKRGHKPGHRGEGRHHFGEQE